MRDDLPPIDREEIAIIGMAGRFPGADSVDRFWRNIADGVGSIRPFTPEELRAAGVDEATVNDPDFVNAGALLDDPAGFDAPFFGMSPREAEITDPQHRHVLEVAWEALEHAGYDPARVDGPIGVFGGVAPNTYFQRNVSTHRALLETLGNYPVMIANEREYAITRVSFKLDLKGPSLSINTACSTSGVAIHMACQSLLNGESDMALAGGARIRVPLSGGYLYQEDGILSPDGSCRTFDADARGTVVGNGAAMVVLKRLSDALRDGDTVHAVIKGSAINNDGAHKVGFTAPSVQGQAAVIAEAQALAEVDADTIGYVEAHGTATALGDPIEVAALTQAFRETSDRVGFCGIGSVKSNIGHLDAGAGAAGVIKAAMALKHRQLPPTLNFERPNPQIDFASSPFFVSDSLKAWPQGETPRRAGVSSFGLGGTNAHVILEEAPEPSATDPGRPLQLLPLSARSDEALDRATDRLADHLADADDPLADVAYTLQLGRRAFERRRILVAADRDSAVAELRAKSPLHLIGGSASAGERGSAFLFPGGGAQYVNMALDVYREEAHFRSWVDRCAELLTPMLDRDLRTLLFPERYPSELSVEEAQALLETPSLALAALVTIEIALAQQWSAWGVRPDAVMGHSAGEYAAAYLAGVLSLEDALAIVVKRGQLFETLEEGSMLSVPLGEDELRPLLDDGLAIAVVNRPDACVVSGPTAAIDALEATLDQREIDATRLHISVAAHSELVDPILEPFRDFLDTVAFHPPQLPFVSAVSGDWIDADEVQTADYWVRHLRQTVRFSDALETIFERPDLILLEVGPGQALSSFARHHPSRPTDQAVVASARHPREQVSDLAFLLTSVGRLWLAGYEIDWRALHGDDRRRRVPLPSYPFEHRRYWLDPADAAEPAPDVTSAPSQGGGTTYHLPEGAGPAMGVVKADERTPDVTTPNVAPAVDRKGRIVRELKTILFDISGFDPEAMDEQVSFLELGFDSLLLTQASTSVKRTFKVRVSFRQLFDEAPSISALAEFIDGKLPADALPPDPEPAPASAAAAPAGPQAAPAPAATAVHVSGGGADALERVVNAQLQIMADQLNLLRGGAGAALPAPSGAGANAGTPAPAPQPAASAVPAAASGADADGGAPRVEPAKAGTAIGPVGDIKRATARDLDEAQRAYIDGFIERYTQRTATSKDLTAQNRPHLADATTVYGFSPLLKEVTYLIHLNRSDGAWVYDVDGNAYVDLTMGFGSNLLGHSPEFVTAAVRRQLESGVELCGISPLAGEVADLVREMTGLERVAFANSGSEAVLGALRLARTATGKEKIVMFTGAYHGRYDAVLVGSRTVRGERRSIAQVPGVTGAVAEDTIVLGYDDPNAFEVIREHADDIAAVIVEPVQSRNPDIQPRAFLHALRALTEELEIALIFDEVITGFRAHLGGAQAFFGVQADIATYGKAMGGGMPIAVVAGKAEYMDAFDGGPWHYGDDSFPEAGVTFLGGTFIRHPIALAAAHASLTHLKERGPALQIELNERTAAFVDPINEDFAAAGVPVRLNRFSSWFVFRFLGDQPYSAMLFPQLRDRGVHVYESSRCFLSTAHTDDDVARIGKAIRDAVAEMMERGLLTAVEPEPHGGGGGSDATDPELVSFAADGSLRVPLTEAQREIWLATRLGSGASMAYNVAFSLDLRGPLDTDELHRALQRVVDRHEALRTTIDPEGGFQQIAASMEIALPLSDLTTLDGEGRRSALADIAGRHTGTPFDLTNGPLIRADLVRSADDHHTLIVGTHHIVCDGWSIAVVLRETGALYSAAVRGAPVALAEPMQFRAFAAWQRSPEVEEEAAEADAYWREQFRDVPPPLDLPSDRPRPPRRSFEADRAQLRVDQELYGALQRFGRDRGFTLFNVLLAGLEILLFRLSGQDDLTIGITSAGQTMVDGEALVGHGVNLLPIRRRLDADVNVADLLSEARGAVLDAFEHRSVGYGSLVGRLNLPRDPSRAPLISTIFNLDPDMDGYSFEGLGASLAFVPRRYDGFDLFVNCLDRNGELVLEMTYNRNLFDEETVMRWLGLYRTLLAQMVDGADLPIAELSLLDDQERERLLQPAADVSDELPDVIHRAFEVQAALTPDATALTHHESTTTYVELDRRANRLAHHLASLGIGPGTTVAIAAPRSATTIIGLLATLKAGAAYVPLDPKHPAERLAFMLVDSGAEVVLADTTSVDRLPSERLTTVLLDDLPDLPENEGPPDVEVGPDDPAYVIYTSGSTGTPKGVVGLHRGALNRFAWMWRSYPFTEDEVACHKTTLSFVDAVWEIFGPLLRGVPIAVIDDTTLDDPYAFVAALAERRVGRIVLVPSLIRVLLDSVDDLAARLPDLALWITSGEGLPAELARRFHTALPGRTLLNLYGSSEVSADVTAYEVPNDWIGARVPIGKPIDNTEILVLDTRMQLVPVGIQGEIYVGGAGLAAGYRGRPELTAERFVPHPFREGGRLFRTGDRGRWSAGGELEYLGRADDQVKVRGVRIELGEVVHHLERYPDIEQAVVAVDDDGRGDALLTAYVVTGGAPLDLGALRGSLRGSLPEVMVPTSFVPLDAIPLTVNGKVDRQALPTPQRAQTVEADAFQAPRTPVEATLATLWSDALQLDRVGVNDNFFELGGDSLLVMRILAKGRQAGLQLTAQHFFEYQTIATMAPQVEAIDAVVGDQGPVRGRVPLTPAQLRFLVDRDTPDPHHWNIATLYASEEALDPEALRTTVARMLEHHDALRIRFERVDGAWRQFNEPNIAEVPFRTVDLSHLAETEQRAAIETTAAELQAGFDLAVAPLLRVVHFHLGGSRGDRVLLIAHHFVTDAVSWNLFWHDFVDVYRTLSVGGPAVLPPKSTSFQRWSQLLSAHAQSPELAERLPGWLALPWDRVARLPRDVPANGALNTNASARDVVLELDANDTRALLEISSEAYRVDELMLAALSGVLATWTGSRTVLIDMLGHGREPLFRDVDLSHTVGLFLSYTPLVFDLTGRERPDDILEAVAGRTRALPGSGLDLDLFRYLSDDPAVQERVRALPQAEVLFNYRGRSIAHPAGFGVAEESIGSTHSPRGLRHHPLGVVGDVVDDRLRVRFVYSSNIHREATIEALAIGFIDLLRSLIAERSAPRAS